MIDSPSIVPDLADLTALVALVNDYPTTDRDEWETELFLAKLRTEERAICARAPHLAFPAHALVEGALYVRRQSEAGRQNRQDHKPRNFKMAAECISRRADPAYDDRSDIQLIIQVGALPPYGLSKSQARAAVLEGLRAPRNQEKIKQFGDHGRSNRRRSIFDGTKEIP